MTAYSDIRQRADAAWRAWQRPERTRIDVSVCTASHAANGHATLLRLQREIASRGLVADIGVVGDNGFSFLEPQVIVSKPDGSRVLYGPVREADVPELLDQALTGVCAR